MLTKDLHKRTIYPPPWAVELTGGTASDLNGAVMCWAHATVEAAHQLEGLFTEGEWGFLHTLLFGHEVDPANPHPGHSVAGFALTQSSDFPSGMEWFRRDMLPKLLALPVAQAHTLQAMVNTAIKTSKGWFRAEEFLKRLTRRNSG